MSEEKKELTESTEDISDTLHIDKSERNLDFSGVSALAGPIGIPDPWWYRAGLGILKVVSKLLCFIAAILIDVLRSLLKVIVGIFAGIGLVFVGIGKLFRGAHRMFWDMDWSGKLSYVILGFSQIKRKLWLDGFVFLAVEVAFLLFMFLPIGGGPMGLTALISFFTINANAHMGQGSDGAQSVVVSGFDSRPILVMGFLTICVVIGFVLVYILSVRATYDVWQIENEAKLKHIRRLGIDALNHPNYFEEDFSKLNRLQIKSLLVKKYGYTNLEARYISRIKFQKIPVKVHNGPIYSFYKSVTDPIKAFFYKGYDKVRNFLMSHYDYCSPIERYCQYYPKPPKEKYGRHLVLKEAQLELIRFSHKFDKYNDYLAKIRDYSILSDVYSKGELLYNCVFKMDPVSIKNGEKALEETAKLSAKETIPNVVGVFEITLELAKYVTNDAVKTIARLRKELRGEDLKKATLEHFAMMSERYDKMREGFIDENKIEVVNALETAINIYRDPSKVEDDFHMGKKHFIGFLMKEKHLNRTLAMEVAASFNNAYKTDDAYAYLKIAADNLEPYKEAREETPFHGQPTRSKKRFKQFSDEKFAITVLSLPVIGAVLLSIIPLLCSLATAFTNWDRYHRNNQFVWTADAWIRIFDIFGSNTRGSWPYTFGKLLLWTLIWAVLATFTNYFAGIVVALIINRKSIKYKKAWRTFFIVTIAIPQFISLLIISKLFASEGLINTWLMRQPWYVNDFSKAVNFGSYNPTTGEWIAHGIPWLGGTGSDVGDYAIPKTMIILINMWVGIPYTILSTTGILMNIPEDLYESSQIDGAGPFRQLISITMPYIFFVTGPSLLSTFIGNINNFNVIYFLTGGGPSGSDAQMVQNAGGTDLLITWLYKLTRDDLDYSVASVIGIVIFLICAFFSMIVYGRLGSVKNEEDFQ